MWLECTERDSKDSRKTGIKNWQSLWLCWALLLRQRAGDYFYPYFTHPWKKRYPERPLGFVASKKICYFPPFHFYLVIELWTLVVMQHGSIRICGQEMASRFAIYTLKTQMKSWIQGCCYPKLAGQIKTASMETQCFPIFLLSLVCTLYTAVSKWQPH